MASPSMLGQCSSRFTLMRDMPSEAVALAARDVGARHAYFGKGDVGVDVLAGHRHIVWLTLTPGRSRSTSTAEIAGGEAPASVTHMTMAKSAKGAPLM